MGSTPDSHEMNGLTTAIVNGDGKDDATPPEEGRRQWLRTNRQINMNHYANKKSAAESMLDIALLMANASQLKAVMEQGPTFGFYVPLIILISISLALQIGVGVLLIFLDTNILKTVSVLCASFTWMKKLNKHVFLSVGLFTRKAILYNFLEEK
ncbi:ninjurin-1 isoform X2 [Crotalus tigris]|uniref:ninjurin-1 isoform X2 n=1 Tax=Crotalus tigris TaxID=88082 RepID=UPI00192F1A35|nr:ninjurin-1 isoform X2 [Crotalus tigris]